MNTIRYSFIAAIAATFCGNTWAGSLFGAKPADAPAGSAPAADAPGGAPPPDNTPLDDRFYLAPMFSYAPAANSRNTNDGIGGTLVLGKPVVPHLSLELLGDYLRYKGKTDSVQEQTQSEACAINATSAVCPIVTTTYPSNSLYSGGVGANAYLSPANSGFFLHADAMYGNRFVYDGGPGADIALGTLHRFSLRGEVLYHKEAHFKAEPEFNLGLMIRFGKQPEPAITPAPEPVAVVPVEPPPPPPKPECRTPVPGERINLDGCGTGDVIVLNGVNFEFNKATLTDNAKTILNDVDSELVAHPDIKVELAGHTDGRGSESYNLKLSQRRAESVRSYLMEHGVDGDRMTAVGYGKTQPIASNDTDEGRALNRRTELRITASNGEAASGVSVPTGVIDAAPAQPSTPAAVETDSSH